MENIAKEFGVESEVRSSIFVPVLLWECAADHRASYELSIRYSMNNSLPV